MKKVKNPIKLDLEKHCIIINRQFGIHASVIGSPEYKQLSEVKSNFPNFEIVIRTISQPSSEHYKGLTYEYMEYYISTHADAKKRLEEFNEIKLRANCHSMKYGKIKQWFLATYPQIDDFTPEDFAKERKAAIHELLDVA